MVAGAEAREGGDDFVDDADKYGLPVAFLRGVGRDYTIKTDDENVTDVYFNVIKFSAETIQTAEHLEPKLPLGAAVAVQSIYHEAAHAYLDLVENDPKVKAFMSAGEAHYKGAPVMLEGSEKATSSPFECSTRRLLRA